MKDYIEERVIELARYILETNATVRATAKISGKQVHSSQGRHRAADGNQSFHGGKSESRP